MHGNLLLPANTGRLEIFVHDTGFTTLVVDGDTPESTRMAAEVLTYHQDFLPDGSATYVELVDGEFQITHF